MSAGSTQEVFSAEELARAAGVPHTDVLALMAAGQVRLVPGTRFMAGEEAIRVARRLRATMAEAAPVASADLFAEAGAGDSVGHALAGSRGRGLPAVMSSLVHAALIVVVVLMTSLNAGSESTDVPDDQPTHLVFLVTPGPGGGGGGGGARNRLPAPRIERRGPQRSQTAVPAVTPEPAVKTAREIEPPAKPTPAAPVLEAPPAPREPEPVPQETITAPVVAANSSPVDREGVIEHPRGNADSRGSGDGGGSGTGRGTGNGEGSGDGIGPGQGGGIGGGPYRPGSGITPPRLLREVKAVYTDEARRRGITGSVVLEIVIRRDGSVGDVTIQRGLGAGLDQSAVQAVRQWRFDPSRKQGVPVDVLVEVAVEFTQR